MTCCGDVAGNPQGLLWPILMMESILLKNHPRETLKIQRKNVDPILLPMNRDKQQTPAKFQTFFAGVFISAAVLLAMPPLSMATQGHGGAEGLYVHQMSHLFFSISMGILIFWLKARGLTRHPAWRFIGYAAFMFLFWSMDAFTVHLLDEQLHIVTTRRIGHWNIQIEPGLAESPVGLFYYLAKLDHLFCVPAIVFFYVGLRRLSIRAVADQKEARGKETA